jgi:hypothetical protein
MEFPSTAVSIQAMTMKVRITIGGEQTLIASLDNSPAARDFAALLPLRLSLSDYAQTEKISELPQRLPTQGEPEGYTPRSGDICYYAPWGNLAIFHKNFRYSTGLIRLGRLDGDVEALRQAGPLNVVIEQVRAEQVPNTSAR